jgi:hypothetical protein
MQSSNNYLLWGEVSFGLRRITVPTVKLAKRCQQWKCPRRGRGERGVRGKGGVWGWVTVGHDADCVRARTRSVRTQEEPKPGWMACGG